MKLRVVEVRDIAALRRRKPLDRVGRRKVSVEAASDVECIGGKIRASGEHCRIVEIVERADAACRQRPVMWTTSPNRSRLLPTSVTLLSGRTLAIARFGWGEVGGGGRERWQSRAITARPPTPTPPQPKLRIPRVRPLNGGIEIGNSRFRFGGGRRNRP